MNKKLKDKKLFKLTIICLYGVAVITGLIFCNTVGSVKIPFGDIVKVIISHEQTTEHLVIWGVRIPRTILAALVGMNLALSGAILQGVMKNPLADPGIIGISAGAGLAAIIILILSPHHQMLVPLVAFIGALGAAIMIYILAWKGGIQPLRIILAGVAVSAFLGAGISALMVFYSDRVHGALMFMTGSFSGRSWPHVWMILPYCIAGLLVTFPTAQKMNILILGDDKARSLGLNVELVRLGMTVVAAFLAASAVSVAGILGFVGLIVPHTVRLMIGSDYKYLFPGSALLGAALVMYSDTFARTVFSPVEIPVGVVMAVLGAPFFLYLLRRDR